jgi:hypothetical protein
MLRNIRFLITLGLILVVVVSTLGVACSAGKTAESANASNHHHPMAPLSDMPPDVQTASVTFQEAYQFAVANPDLLDDIPCYCGCGGLGHRSNYDCYVKGVTAGGNILFDRHALGCQVCVDITHDTMRLLDEGKSSDEIYAAIDEVYSQFGRPTILIE